MKDAQLNRVARRAPVAPSHHQALTNVRCSHPILLPLTPRPPVVCNEFKPECKETVTEWQLLNPTAPGAPADAYAQSAVAACHVMGFNTFTTGSQHMVGAAEDDCYTGKGWSRGNWWTKLVCCK